MPPRRSACAQALAVLFAALLVATAACSRAEAPPDSVLRHRVEGGENLAEIARHYRIPLSRLIRANELHSRELRPGQVLLVPGGVKPEPQPEPQAVEPQALDASMYMARSTWTSTPIDLGNVDPMHPRPYRITIHHTGRIIDQELDGAELMRVVEREHRKKGWAGIGYHFVISADGRVWEGRPLRFQGAHARGDNNVGNIGISVAGNFDRQQLSPLLERRLRHLLDVLRRTYRIPPHAVHGHEHYTIAAGPGAALARIVGQYAGR